MSVVPEQYFVARVHEVRPLTPVMRRIVLGGDGLQDFRSSGVADEWFRFLFPAAGQERVPLPSQVDGHWVFAEPEPESRWYTVRGWDAERQRSPSTSWCTATGWPPAGPRTWNPATRW